ncbi:atlastin-like [Chironomus tepperi]|uniref:atlastin-like n=1 Tax=Chironomus tepperi TaxID=113505 RepID=UPI00391FBCB0
MNIEKFGKPLTILKFSQDAKSFQDDSDMLKDLFLHEKVKDRKIVLFSIVGSFRRGKSFFLDYCLRYLYANYDSLNRQDTKFKKDLNWMGHQNEKLSGFSWRSGAERDTTGIIFWSDVFFYTNNLNEKCAIFVVDTQGLFDNDTTLMENSQIFALSSLISSIQVINLNGNIREDELDYFQFAMEFGKLAKKDGNESKEFQKLVFLVRDWQNPDDYEFGEIGGAKYLNHVLELKSNRNEDLNSVREFLSKSCEKLACHLLPHPGKLVAGRKEYKGQWSLMDEDFRSELFDSIEDLLNSDNLVVKKVAGRQLSAENFFIHLQTYFKHFASSDIPKVATMYKLLVEKDLSFLVEKAFRIYEEKLATFENLAKSEAQIENYFKSSKESAISDFKNERKLGDAGSIKNAGQKLNDKIDSHYKKWKATQLKFLNDQLAIEKLKANADLIANKLASERQKNEVKDKKINELNTKVQEESEDKARTVKSLNEKLARAKATYEDLLESEKSKYASALAQAKSRQSSQSRQSPSSNYSNPAEKLGGIGGIYMKYRDYDSP